MESSKVKFLYWLEFLRGLACILVVVHHYWFSKSFEYFDLGYMGVSLFFIISGYIVTKSVKNNGYTLSSFVISRFSRLYPVYWFSIFFVLTFINNDFDFLTVFSNLTMGPNFFLQDSIISVFWTLHVELLFYMVLSLMLYRGKIEFRFFFIAAWLAIIVSFVMALFRFWYDVKTPVALFLGLSIILLSSLMQVRNREPIFISYFLMVSLLLVTIFFSYSKDWGHGENPVKFILSYLASVSIFLIVKKLEVNPGYLLRSLGAWSYSIYLFHLPILVIVKEYVTPSYNQYYLYLSFFITIAFSFLTFNLIEKPLNIKIKCISRKWLI